MRGGCTRVLTPPSARYLSPLRQRKSIRKRSYAIWSKYRRRLRHCESYKKTRLVAGYRSKITAIRRAISPAIKAVTIGPP